MVVGSLATAMGTAGDGPSAPDGGREGVMWTSTDVASNGVAGGVVTVGFAGGGAAAS